MGRYFLAVFVALLMLALDPTGQGARANEYDHLVAKHAAAHGVPPDLVRRVIQIETRGNPSLVNKGNYGLMQIRLGTARAMGYSGDAGGLLDADTNMTYAVRYLAGAYRAAGGNSEQAIRNYQRGYYGQAKAQGFSPYAVASTPQAAAPDPTMLPRQQDMERRKAADLYRHAMLEARISQQKAAEQTRAAERQAMLQARAEQQQTAERARVAQRQAMMQERIDRRHALQQQRAEQQQAMEQARAAQRQAMVQQKIERDQAKVQQRIELEQAKASAQISAPPIAAAIKRPPPAPAYSWYHPMRYFKHPSHQANPLPRER